MRLIAFGTARLNSTRCKNKMLRPYADTSLAELAVKRLASLTSFDDVFFAAHENELLDVSRDYLPAASIIERSRESALENTSITVIYDYLRDIDFDYCMWINSCHAFLKPSTIESAATRFKQGKSRSMTAVRKRYSWFYTLEGRSINNIPTAAATEQSVPLLEVTHAFHIYQKDHFFKTASYWNNTENDPELFQIDDVEALDVDTETDFLISESIYNATLSEKNNE